MSIAKRVLALAGAAATAVVLGGVFGASRPAHHVEAAGPDAFFGVGCAASTLTTDLAWPINAVTGIISGPQIVAPGVLTGNPINAATTFFNQLSFISPQTAIECSFIGQDATAGGAIAGNPRDLDPNTIDQGTVTYTLTSPNNLFQILESNGAVAAVQCSAAGGTVVGGQTVEGCQGATAAFAGTVVAGVQTVPGIVVATPSNVIHVGFKTGVTFGLFTNGNGLFGGISLQAAYQRATSLNPPAGVGVGPATATASTNITVIMPTYSMTLAGNPSTIPAASGTGQGSTITASLFSTNQVASLPIGGGVVLRIGSTSLPGAEPGTVTFFTTSGIFGAPGTSQVSGAQQVAVQCGFVPNSSGVFVSPTTLQFNFSFTACLTATATLYGGGAAGSAQVTANFVGEFTGATATASTVIAFSPTAQTYALTPGCNQVVTPSSLAPATPISVYLSGVTPAGIVVSAWTFDNVAKVFRALFFNVATAPVDITSVGPNQALFLCVSAAGTVPTGNF